MFLDYAAAQHQKLWNKSITCLVTFVEIGEKTFTKIPITRVIPLLRQSKKRTDLPI